MGIVTGWGRLEYGKRLLVYILKPVLSLKYGNTDWMEILEYGKDKMGKEEPV